MAIPNEFRRLASMMHQDIDLFISMKDEMEVVRYLAGSLRKGDADSVRRFLEELLLSERSNDDLTAIWAEAGSDWHVSGNGIRRLLSMLRDHLGDEAR